MQDRRLSAPRHALILRRDGGTSRHLVATPRSLLCRCLPKPRRCWPPFPRPRSRPCCSRRVCATSGCAAPNRCVPGRPASSGRPLRCVSCRRARTSRQPASWSSPVSTRAAIEAMPPGAIAVVDAMGVTEAGIFGDILCARMAGRGVAGLVTDGVVRDLAGVLSTGLPVWCRGQAAPPLGRGADLRGLAAADRLWRCRGHARRRHRGGW